MEPFTVIEVSLFPPWLQIILALCLVLKSGSLLADILDNIRWRREEAEHRNREPWRDSLEEDDE